MNNVTPAIYHETIGYALDAAFAAFSQSGAELDLNTFFNEYSVQPMKYESSQTLRVPLASYKGKPTKRQGVVSLYRMHTGRYELTCYLS